ncbi:MAG: hypothetical protein EXX96DRAFT_59025 [Benjaminiella poitrasii]|nr:MAG: hypothetical protein EXX96DRAFT_59025 [Benjaminiella poitrasii]
MSNLYLLLLSFIFTAKVATATAIPFILIHSICKDSILSIFYRKKPTKNIKCLLITDTTTQHILNKYDTLPPTPSPSPSQLNKHCSQVKEMIYLFENLQHNKSSPSIITTTTATKIIIEDLT